MNLRIILGVFINLVLESWEYVLLDLSWGFLLGGIIFFIFSLITAEFQFDHDSDISDLSVETEIHIGGSFDVATDIDVDTGFEIGHADVGHAEIGHHDFGHHDFGHDVGHQDIGHHDIGHTDADGSSLDQNPSTPILLILSTFSLMFGAIGVTVYESQFTIPLVRLILVIFLPIGFVKLISYTWKKLTKKEHGLEIPFVTIDNAVKTLTHVDELGGLVLADTGDYERPETLRSEEKIKMQAKTLPGVRIERDSVAYVVAIDDKNTLIIDLWPKLASKKNT